MASAELEGKPVRRNKRTRVVLTATLLTPKGAYKVRIRDISPSGAQVIGVGDIPASCDALLKRESLFAAARVVWSGDNEAGLTFYRPLSSAELDPKLQVAISAARKN